MLAALVAVANAGLALSPYSTYGYGFQSYSAPLLSTAVASPLISAPLAIPTAQRISYQAPALAYASAPALTYAAAPIGYAAAYNRPYAYLRGGY